MTLITEEINDEIHVFANGIKVEKSMLMAQQEQRYAKTNIHEPEEEAWFNRILSDCSDRPIRFWDIGAAIGYYSILVARMCPNSIITAFEPLPHHADAIERHWKLNKLDPARLTLRREAVSDREGEASLVGQNYGSRLATKPVISKASLNVPLIMLEQILASGADIIDLAKVDVQGGEADVLRGAGSMASQVKNWIVGTHGPKIHVAVEQAFLALGAELLCNEKDVKGQPDGLIVARFGN